MVYANWPKLRSHFYLFIFKIKNFLCKLCNKELLNGYVYFIFTFTQNIKGNALAISSNYARTAETSLVEILKNPVENASK